MYDDLSIELPDSVVLLSEKYVLGLPKLGCHIQIYASGRYALLVS